MVSLDNMRIDARAAFDAAVAAVQPENLIPARVEHSRNEILINGTPIPHPAGRRVVFAIGKAAPGMAAAWMRSAPDWATEVYVLTPHKVPVHAEIEGAVKVLRGAHPYPDADGEASTRSLLEVLAWVDKHERPTRSDAAVTKVHREALPWWAERLVAEHVLGRHLRHLWRASCQPPQE
mgnify:CR=1 FL=1